jgi:hypothetical protein
MMNNNNYLMRTRRTKEQLQGEVNTRTARRPRTMNMNHEQEEQEPIMI